MAHKQKETDHDLRKETMILLANVGSHLPEPVNSVTLWRWSTEGLRGVVLETVKIASRRYTSVEALDRFIAATNDLPPIPRPGRAKKSEERDDSTKRRLKQAGVLK